MLYFRVVGVACAICSRSKENEHFSDKDIPSDCHAEFGVKIHLICVLFTDVVLDTSAGVIRPCDLVNALRFRLCGSCLALGLRRSDWHRSLAVALAFVTWVRSCSLSPLALLLLVGVALGMGCAKLGIGPFLG